MTRVSKTVYQVLGYEIAHGTQRSVGILYGICICSFLDPDSPIGQINRAIVSRWSVAGLERIKKIAWEINDAMTQEPSSTAQAEGAAR